MKFGILIQDLTADQARTVINDLGGLSAPSNVQQFHQPLNISAPSSHVVTNAVEDDEGNHDDGAAFDASGIPWDGRIHATTKTKTNKGMWKKLKGAQPVDIANVEAELRARVQSAPSAPAAPVAPQAPTPQLNVPTYGGAPTAPAAPVAPQAPVAPTPPPMPAPVAAPTPPPAPVAPARDFNGLTQQIANLLRAGRIQHDYPNTIVARINSGFNISTVNTIVDIANDPAMIDYAWQCLDVDGNAA